MKKIFLLLTLLVTVLFSQAQNEDKFEKRLNKKSIPKDVLDYTLLITSPFTGDGKNEKINEWLQAYKGKYFLSTGKNKLGEAGDKAKVKYGLMINQDKSSDKSATYSLVIFEINNPENMENANIESWNLEKLLGFYISKLNETGAK